MQQRLLLEPDQKRAASDEEVIVLQWRVHPLRDDPARVIPLVVAGYVVALLFWWTVFPVPAGLLLPLGALTFALSDALLPTTYRITTRGVYADCGLSRLFLSWDDVRRARYGADGVFLSPLSLPSRLDSFRGIRLRFADNEAAVLEAARRLRAEAVA